MEIPGPGVAPHQLEAVSAPQLGRSGSDAGLGETLSAANLLPNPPGPWSPAGAGLLHPRACKRLLTTALDHAAAAWSFSYRVSWFAFDQDGC